MIQYVEHENLEYPANLDIDSRSQVFKSYAICQSPIIKFTIPLLSQFSSVQPSSRYQSLTVSQSIIECFIIFKYVFDTFILETCLL